MGGSAVGCVLTVPCISCIALNNPPSSLPVVVGATIWKCDCEGRYGVDASVLRFVVVASCCVFREKLGEGRAHGVDELSTECRRAMEACFSRC